jgi:hypothetical protein
MRFSMNPSLKASKRPIALFGLILPPRRLLRDLIGSIVPDPKVPAITNNRFLYRDGTAIGVLVAGETRWLQNLELREMPEAESALVKRQPGTPRLACF